MGRSSISARYIAILAVILSVAYVQLGYAAGPATTSNIPLSWINTSFNVTFDCVPTDYPCAAVYYTLDGSDPYPPPSPHVDNSSNWTFAINDEGVYNITYRGVDENGTFELPKNETLMIDKTPPSLSCSNTTSPNANGWYNSDVTIHFSASDSVSGMSFISGDMLLTVDGANRTTTGSAKDNANNWINCTSNRINIDKTPPFVAITFPAAGSYVKGVITVNATATDSGSGIYNVSFYERIPANVISTQTTPPFSQPYNTQAEPGDRTLTFGLIAYDLAGNVFSSTTVTVASDNTPPSLAVSSPANQTYPDCNVTLNITVSDSGSGLSSCSYDLDNVTAFPLPGCYNKTLAGLAGGAHNLVVYAKDNMNNQISRSVSFSVNPSCSPAPATPSSPSGGSGGGGGGGCAVNYNISSPTLINGTSSSSVSVPVTVTNKGTCSGSTMIIATVPVGWTAANTMTGVIGSGNNQVVDMIINIPADAQTSQIIFAVNVSGNVYFTHTVVEVYTNAPPASEITGAVETPATETNSEISTAANGATGFAAANPVPAAAGIAAVIGIIVFYYGWRIIHRRRPYDIRTTKHTRARH